MLGGNGYRPCPVSLDCAGRLAVVIGGGSVAENTIRLLLGHGADVNCIAPLVTPGIDQLVAEGHVAHEERGYVRGDLAGAFLVVSATDSVEVDRAVYQEAEGQGSLVNVPHALELSNFVLASGGEVAEESRTGAAAPSDADG